MEFQSEEMFDAKVRTKVQTPPSLEGKEKNIQNIDYDFTSVFPREINQYSRLIDQEFKLSGWSK